MQIHGTTIICVRRNKQVSIGGDGQVTFGNIVMKHSTRKVKRLFHNQVLGGFAGSTADAFTLFELFEAKLEKHQGNLVRSSVELAKGWRGDRVLRRLEAMLIVADKSSAFTITGQGDVVEPENGLMAIGSGGPYAQAAAMSMLDTTDLPAEQIVKKSLAIAGHMCIYTNTNLTIETIEDDR